MLVLVLVIRFILFIFGISLGMAAAIAALPLPGKTFFNRMSRLPKGVRSLIDNSIDLAISVTQLISIITREIAVKANQTAGMTKEKFTRIKHDIQEQIYQAKDRQKTLDDALKDDKKKEVKA